jgi:small-conductance mechanosensitive channel
MAELFTNPLADAVIINLLSAGIYLVLGIILISLFMRIISSFLRDKDMKNMLSRIGIKEQGLDIILSASRLYLYFMLFLIVLGRLGISSVLTDLIIVLLVVSVIGIILLALRNIIPNAAAGVYMSSTKMINKGDRIRVDKFEGVVEETTLINTVLKRKGEEKIIIPNALLIKKEVVKK